MDLVPATALVIHIASAMFWGGTTLVQARLGNTPQMRSLFAPQIGAAVLAILSGAVLWSTLRGGSFVASDRVLALGSAAALIAAILQILIEWALRAKPEGLGFLRSTSARRVVGGLIGIAVLGMALWRVL
ncbi:MAG: hypothetical protein JWN11_1233, partial [Hyphomicrobiales bacterium]|nr:hypothetical protein [Hyphomicrobiales bacterium]